MCYDLLHSIISSVAVFHLPLLPFVSYPYTAIVNHENVFLFQDVGLPDFLGSHAKFPVTPALAMAQPDSS